MKTETNYFMTEFDTIPLDIRNAYSLRIFEQNYLYVIFKRRVLF